tara:strand:+ start:14500 stop:15987 length:1488 start_codon:yes stop_codon:yes gene_type:complete
MITRWICEGCNLKWIYPVEKCLHCRGEIKKQIGNEIKVIGITKVSIPSPMHPDIPYYVLLLQDENGNRIPKKSMKEYNIGDLYKEEKSDDVNAVSIIKTKYDIKQDVKKSLELIKANSMFNSDSKIFIKPSVTVPAYSYQGANTNSEVVDGLIKTLLEWGVKNENISLGEQSFNSDDFESVMHRSGISKVCDKYQIKVIDISKAEYSEIVVDDTRTKSGANEVGFKFEVLKQTLDHIIINVPVFKTNQQIGFSGGIENLIRLGSKKTQEVIFANNFNKMLAKFVLAVNNNAKGILNIGDGSIGMHGQGPTTLGEPAFLNLIMASRNALALDSAFCKVSDIKEIKYINELKNISELGDIITVGDDVDSINITLKKPETNKTAHPDIGLIDGNGCYNCFYSVINLTSKLAGCRGEKIRIAIGTNIPQVVLEGDRVVVFGDCAINKLKQDGVKVENVISDKLSFVEQMSLMKSLLTKKGKAVLTPIDKVKSKIGKMIK